MEEKKNKRQKQVSPKEKVQNTIAHLQGEMISYSDPLGSYTGRPLEDYETPVQDADDL